MTDFQNEWAILHSDIEKYQRFSLIIKLFSILTCTLSIAFSINTFVTIFIILVLWLQDGIWVTFQQRLESRVLVIEDSIKNLKNNNAFQLYSEWQSNRPGSIKLLTEYTLNSLKPTVAYPYIALIVLLIIISPHTGIYPP